MDVKDKIMSALSRALKPAHIRLENEDGVYGFVISRRFHGMSARERQEVIDKALTEGSLTRDERRQVRMITPMSPVEFKAVGTPIRIYQVKETTRGTVELLFSGGPSDADYLRGALLSQKELKTSQPEQIAGVPGGLWSCRAKGTEASPLTKEKAVRVLKRDPYIEVLANANETRTNGHRNRRGR